MGIRINYEFLFAGKDESGFLENYTYDLFQDHGEKSGQIFISIEVQNNPVDAEEIGNLLFETMQKVFFEDVSLDPYERFEVSLKAMNEILSEFKSQKNSGYIGNLNMIVAAIVGEALYLSQCGDAEAYLIRKHYVSVVSDGLNDESSEDDVFSNIASGSVEVGDFILFSSTRLLRYISKTDLGVCLHKNDINKSLAEISDVISTEMLGRVALTGILLSESVEDDFVVEGDRILDDSFDDKSEFNDESEFVSEESFMRADESMLDEGRKMVASKDKKQIRKRFNYLPSVKNSFLRFFEKKNNNSSSIGVSNKSGFKGKGKVLIALVIVIVLLIGGVFFVNSQNVKRAELAKLETTLAGVQTKISEAQTKGSYDKENAVIILDKAYSDALEVLNSGFFREKANLYLVQIEDTRDSMDNVKRVENPTVLADLSAKRSDISALGFVELGDRVFVYEYNALYELVLDQIQDPITIDDEESVIAATGFDDRSSIIFLTKSGKLIEYLDGTLSFMDTVDGTFHKAVALDDWSNKIYLLDPVSNQIWKYTYKGSSEKFGESEPYFVADSVDISSSVDLAIDASVYVLNMNSDIYKFYGGQKAEFYIQNPPFNSFDDPSVIYTNDKLDQVYVLDGQGARVFIFDKDLETGNVIYQSQYLFEGVGELRDLYVDADAKKLYVLSSSKIFEVAF